MHTLYNKITGLGQENCAQVQVVQVGCTLCIFLNSIDGLIEGFWGFAEKSVHGFLTFALAVFLDFLFQYFLQF